MLAAAVTLMPCGGRAAETASGTKPEPVSVESEAVSGSSAESETASGNGAESVSAESETASENRAESDSAESETASGNGAESVSAESETVSGNGAESDSAGLRALPTQFDLRERGDFPAVSDQGNQGTCWAFASLTALSTSMPPEFRRTLSADHMINKNGFGLSYNDGGDYSVSSAYLLAWQGPVAEEDDPYGDGVSPDGLAPVCHVQTIKILREKDYEAIKQAVYETGGVQSSLYLPPENTKERSLYYSESTCGLYYDGDSEANHDVVIIGWDDGYPRENFAKHPSEDGAFLCVNSWGESFGDHGCFYVSYEDSRIGCHNVSYSLVESTDNYSAVYQTDLCGWTGQLGYGTSDAWFANVYRAEKTEAIKAAGFYATMPDTGYRIFVLPLQAEESAAEALSDFAAHGENRKPAAEGQVSDAGFYTVSWEQGISVRAGERFAVIAEIDSPGAVQPVAVEYRANSRSANVDISDGEGYISFDGNKWERAEEKEACNVCLKAYACREK